MCLELIGRLQVTSKDLVVVNLAIDSKRDRTIVADEWLSTGV